jgi:hypothetical protein
MSVIGRPLKSIKQALFFKGAAKKLPPSYPPRHGRVGGHDGVAHSWVKIKECRYFIKSFSRTRPKFTKSFLVLFFKKEPLS